MSPPSVGGSPLAVAVPSSSIRTGHDKKGAATRPFVCYDVVVSAADRKWTVKHSVHRRYSDFCALDETLKSLLARPDGSGAAALPPLPAKRLWGNLDEKVVERRRLELQRYVRFVVADAALANCDAVLDFLGARTVHLESPSQLNNLDAFPYVVRSGSFGPGLAAARAKPSPSAGRAKTPLNTRGLSGRSASSRRPAGEAPGSPAASEIDCGPKGSGGGCAIA